MATKKKQKITVSDGRIVELLQRIDVVLSEEHVNTMELLTVARKMAVSALAQIVRDNPQASETELIDEVTDNLRRALTARILQPTAMPVGEA